MKKYLPIAILGVLVVLPIVLAVFIASERATMGIDRLEQDLVIVQDTIVRYEMAETTKSATNSATISGKVK